MRMPLVTASSVLGELLRHDLAQVALDRDP